MHRRAVRISLLALLLITGLGAGLRVWATERRVQALEDRRRTLDEVVDRVAPAVAGIAAAQQAYVNFGLRDDASFMRVSTFIDQVTTDAATLRSSSYSGEAAAHLEEFWTSLSALTSAETQAVSARERSDDLAAADLLFAASRPQVATLAERLRAFRNAEAESLRLQRANLTQQSWGVLGAVALFWVAGLLALVGIPKPRAGQPDAPGEEVPLPSAIVAPAPTPAAAAVTKPARTTPAASSAQPSAAASPAAPTVDLTATAALCAAITQVTDTSTLPAILERSARLLDAHGIVVWMGAGEDLFPAAAVGYDPAMVARLRPIARTADNATATAWRTGDLRVVSADRSSLGAIVAPMFGGSGCIGVLAAEVRHGRENDPATRAITGIVAAQLAGILGEWPPVSSPAADTGTSAPHDPTGSDRKAAAS
jgi:hypothetical protein